MARASTPTKLPLDTWARIFGLHPLHFNQVRLEGQEDTICNHIYFQHEWQTADHVSREEIARAIAEAEDKIESALGYHLKPSWEVDEWRPTTRPYRPEHVNYNSSDVRGYKQTVKANWGYLISGGIEAKDLVDAGASIVYTDIDSDGYDETATVIVATVAVDPNEIAIFYPGEDGEDSWEIRPTNVVISGGNATITFRRELVVVPEKLELFDIEGAEAIGETDADFLDEVDVYRRYNDPQTQASFLWEPFAAGWCSACNGSGCSICAYTTQTGCLITRGDPRQGIVGFSPASWNSDDNTFDSEGWTLNRMPDIVRLYYYSGWRNKCQRYISRMDPEWERTVAYMAASLLDRPACDCAKGDWSRWRQDLTLMAGDADGNPIYRDPSGLMGQSVLDNPFGSRMGEVYAWRKVRNLQVAQAVSL